jgi:hypothetical protein
MRADPGFQASQTQHSSRRKPYQLPAIVLSVLCSSIPPFGTGLVRSDFYDAAMPRESCIDYTNQYVCYGNVNPAERDTARIQYWRGLSVAVAVA